MITVRVTALKAPWPEGTEVGSTVELKGTSEAQLSGAFLGKCVVTGVDSNATEGYSPSELAAQKVDEAEAAREAARKANEVSIARAQLEAKKQAEEEAAAAELAKKQAAEDEAAKKKAEDEAKKKK